MKCSNSSEASWVRNCLNRKGINFSIVEMICVALFLLKSDRFFFHETTNYRIFSFL